MASNISITGLGSGLDTASIVSALVKSQQAPLDRLNNQITATKAQKTTLSTLTSQLQTLATKAEAMKSASNVRSNTATSSDTSAVSVAVSGAAKTGTFDVSVTTLAAAHRSYSNGVAARDQANLFGTGSISVKVGSNSAVNIPVTATTTLDELASAIEDVDPSLSVGVVYDGTAHRLQISSSKTGAANAVTLSESGTTLGLASAGNIRQAASDASFSFDGIPMTRSTNLIDDAFAGVSLSLNKVTTTAAKVNVASDNTGITTKLQEMVSAYNMVVYTIGAQQTTSGVNASKLSGDSTLAGLKRSLQSMMSTSASGSFTFKSFAELGIATQKDGTITLDTTKLTAALNKDTEGVVGVVSSNPSTAYTGLAEKLAKIAHNYGDTTGVIPTRSRAMDDRIRAMTTNAGQMQTRLDSYEAQLNKRFAAMETLVNQWKATSSSLSNSNNNNDT